MTAVILFYSYSRQPILSSICCFLQEYHSTTTKLIPIYESVARQKLKKVLQLSGMLYPVSLLVLVLMLIIIVFFKNLT